MGRGRVASMVDVEGGNGDGDRDGSGDAVVGADAKSWITY